MANYAIDDGDGYQITTGLQEHEAHRVAQRIANERNESVYLYEEGSEEGSETETEEIAPDTGRRHRHRANSGSGYTLCPCCGYDTVSNDEDEPELCSDCEEAGCAEDGSEPMCDLREEDMSTNARRQRQSSRCDWQTGYGLPHTEQCTKRAIPGSPYCREHSKDFKDRYPGQAYPVDRFHKNSSDYWVWALGRDKKPLTSEGPWGPYDYQGARSYARISATNGTHDRAVSIGKDPTAPSFEIMRVYRAGTGEHKYGVAQMIGAPMEANARRANASEPTYGQVARKALSLLSTEAERKNWERSETSRIEHALHIIESSTYASLEFGAAPGADRRSVGHVSRSIRKLIPGGGWVADRVDDLMIEAYAHGF